MECGMIGRGAADSADKVLSASCSEDGGHQDNAAGPKGGCLMTAPRSDALVLFGATGDLAYKKIFLALQALIRRGHLDIPVVGDKAENASDHDKAAGAPGANTKQT